MIRKQYSQYLIGSAAKSMRAKNGRMSRGAAAYQEKGRATIFINGRDNRVKIILSNSYTAITIKKVLIFFIEIKSTHLLKKVKYLNSSPLLYKDKPLY